MRASPTFSGPPRLVVVCGSSCPSHVQGHDKKMEKSIKSMIDWAKKVNSKKADEEAREEGF